MVFKSNLVSGDHLKEPFFMTQSWVRCFNTTNQAEHPRKVSSGTTGQKVEKKLNLVGNNNCSLIALYKCICADHKSFDRKSSQV